MDLVYLLSGLLVGCLVGLTGVGGGSLMTPLLVFLFGFKPVVAIGTDLLFAALTKTGGVAIHHRTFRSVEWRIVGLLCAGSLPGSVLTLALLRHYLRGHDDVNHSVTRLLGAALLVTAVALLVRKRLSESARKEEPQDPILFQRWQIPTTVLAGLLLGVLVSASSVGAGSLGSVALLLLYPRLPTLKVVGTDLAHAIPLTAIAGLGHWQLGHVDFPLLGSLLVGSLPGIWIGSHLSARIPERLLRPILSVLLLIIGLKLVLSR